MRNSIAGSARGFLLVLAISYCWPVAGQSDPRYLKPVLDQSLQSGEAAAAELRAYLMHKVPRLPTVSSAERWTADAARLRQKFLSEVVFNGWPKAWVDAPLKVEDLGYIPSGKGYRLRKLRFEIVPGFQTVAILYEPAVLKPNMPAILNVNGHLPAGWGKAIEYKQKRCINQALQGILALNIEWLWYGELESPLNKHYFGSMLDLVGANAVGLFYLEMRKGLDYLYGRPDVDRSRIGMTGLSGGGWQTIMLSALDERVTAAVPVAGYTSLVTKLERVQDIGDSEQNPVDMLTILDYPHLTAMRAPRPTLLIYNAEDDCCFRGPLVKPYVFDAVKPFFEPYGNADRLQWYENMDPSTHNYQLDNRLHAYRFFAEAFRLPVPQSETLVDAEIKSPEELTVGLPKDNLTILELARQMAGRLERSALPAEGPARQEWARLERRRLADVVRYHPVAVTHAWAAGNTKSKGMETRSYRIAFDNGLSATGIWLKAIAAPPDAPLTIVLSDKGKKNAAEVISDRLNRGEQVLAVDPILTGDESPVPHLHTYAQLLAAAGDRPLGIEAAQLTGIAAWAKRAFGPKSFRIESSGMRSQVTALVASAFEPATFSEIAAMQHGISSLRFLLDKPVEYIEAPDLFCLALYKYFDLDRLEMLSAPVRRLPS